MVPLRRVDGLEPIFLEARQLRELRVLARAATRSIDPPPSDLRRAVPAHVELRRAVRVQRIGVQTRRVGGVDCEIRLPAPIVHRACRGEVALLYHRPVGSVLGDIRAHAPAAEHVGGRPLLWVEDLHVSLRTGDHLGGGGIMVQEPCGGGAVVDGD